MSDPDAPSGQPPDATPDKPVDVEGAPAPTPASATEPVTDAAAPAIPAAASAPGEVGHDEQASEADSSTDVPAPDDAEDAATLAAHQEPEAKGFDASGLVGLLFWVVIAGGFLYWSFRSASVDVLLNVAAKDPFVVTGSVFHDGAVATKGTVYLIAEDGREGRYLGSATLPISSDGTFATDPQQSFLGLRATDAGTMMRVTARFVGQTVGGNSKPLAGESTVYLNMTPMFGRSPWLVLGLASAPFLLLVYLFTGPLSKRKARVLFAVTYVWAFVACSVPIVVTVWVARNPYLMKMMEVAPVGILIAKAKGLEQPQWVLNVGGAVVRSDPQSSTPPRPPSGSATPGAGQGAPPATPADVAAASPAPTQGAGATPQTSGPAAGSSAATQTRNSEADPSFAEVRGGLAIPLYVILLATIGAGINMTRKLPEIQKDYDSVPATWLGLFGFRSGRETSTVPKMASMRKELIETYMYFVSAPFLAFAVYYLLQVIASSVAEPVLVVVAFATGLMSNTAVGSIVAFADKWLKKAQA